MPLDENGDRYRYGELMSCPRCGSSSRNEIAPGYYECQGDRLVVQRHMVPDPGHPGRERPLEVEVPQPCANRYQEGGPAGIVLNLCPCGTFAIGRCATCGSALCGDHSLLSHGLRRCTRCLTDEAAAIASEKARAAAEGAGERRRQAADKAVKDAQRLQMFLRESAQRGWPCSVEIHESRSNVKTARAANERSTFGWDRGVQPRGWAARRRERLTRPPMTPVVARGWKVGTRKSKRDDGLGLAVTHEADVYLLTDGTRAICETRHDGAVMHRGSYTSFSDSLLAEAVYRLAAAAGISLN